MASDETQLLNTNEPEETEVREYKEGFTIKTVIGALFVALFMLPGGIYLGLVAGQSVGGAAEWVTIVLFAEVARRSYKPLIKQEIYVLFYVASALSSAASAGLGLGGGPFASLIWIAYFVKSPQTASFAQDIPRWAVPDPMSPALLERQLWHPAWLVPIGLLVINELCGRLGWMGMGYVLFRVTSDVEKLPFPMAPVAASGATALAEAGTEGWRWSIFSTGTVIGLLFGAVYVGIPVLTGTLFGSPTMVFPIPFADYTVNIENYLPAAIVGLSFGLGNILVGFVIPFEIVLGSAIASVLGMIIMNPILYHANLLPHYKLGSGAITTKILIDLDFWLSFGIGINIAIAFIGVYLVLKAFMAAKRHSNEKKFSLAPPKGRGDVSIYLALCAWLMSVITVIALCMYLVPGFPWWILVLFGLVWSPLNSYISARMIGVTGNGISFPYIKEASVLSVGYRQVDIWYAPIPMADHGWAAQRFKEVELTGTKFGSIIKAEALMFAIVIPASFLFWSFFWNSNEVPSAMFPYAQKMWPQSASMGAVMQQINTDKAGANMFTEAIKPVVIGIGAASGLVVFLLFTALKWPLLLFYGFVGGLGAFPANTLPTLLGAWIGKRFMARRYGAENWRKYTPVLLAGFSCGTGLVSMLSIALALVAKAVAKLPY